ncbi:MAG: VOC family protein [Pseudobacteriovorax sp.]|nr:VOC family protein [Pseudobacteriovorax sp.]
MAKVTGIGGVFFKAKDPKALNQWYETHLGFQFQPFGGSVFAWPEDKADDKGLTVWCTAKSDTEWFAPSESSFMINYRVDNLEELLAKLKEAGVPILKGPEVHENGSFAWILDPEHNKVELWEPKLWTPPQES